MSELLTIKQVAQRLSCSDRHVRALRNAGRMPEPVFNDKRFLRWSGVDIDEWIRHGCPSAKEWQARKQVKRPHEHYQEHKMDRR